MNYKKGEKQSESKSYLMLVGSCYLLEWVNLSKKREKVKTLKVRNSTDVAATA